VGSSTIPLLEALGEVTDQPVRRAAQLEARQRLVDRRGEPRSRQPPRAPGEAQEARHPQVGIQARGLGDEAQTGVHLGGSGGGGEAVHRDAARGGQQEARHQADEGGLARSVRAQQAEGLAGLDAQADGVEGAMVPEDAGQLARLDAHPGAAPGPGSARAGNRHHVLCYAARPRGAVGFRRYSPRT
jgi:hypothetical protein